MEGKGLSSPRKKFLAPPLVHMCFETKCIMILLFKVVDFGTNRKRVHVCDFLLNLNSNLSRILPRFRESFCPPKATFFPYPNPMQDIFRDVALLGSA